MATSSPPHGAVVGTGVASALGTLVYAPLEGSFCVLGAIGSGFALPFAGTRTAGKVVGSACRGTWVLRKAAALRYNPPRETAPRLVAKGRGVMAERIIEAARRHGVPIREDPFLVEALSTLDLNRQIPPQLYRVVAELLLFLYRLNEEWRRTARRPAPREIRDGGPASGVYSDGRTVGDPEAPRRTP